MATEPVRSTAVVAAPKDYSIPAAQVIRLLSARAVFTDNGAAGDWLPALQILDNNGNVLVTAADPGVKVTAGSDADVSWFPGVTLAAASTPTSTALAFAQGFSTSLGGGGDPVQTIPTGTTKNGRLDHATTTDATVMSWFTSINTNDTLLFHAHGTYLVWGTAAWDAANASLTTLVQNNNGVGFVHDPFLASGNPTFVPTEGLGRQLDFNVLHVTSGNITGWLLHNNLLGVDHNVNAQYFTAVYLGTG